MIHPLPTYWLYKTFCSDGEALRKVLAIIGDRELEKAYRQLQEQVAVESCKFEQEPSLGRKAYEYLYNERRIEYPD